jgi:hypothetical protein
LPTGYYSACPTWGQAFATTRGAKTTPFGSGVSAIPPLPAVRRGRGTRTLKTFRSPACNVVPTSIRRSGRTWNRTRISRLSGVRSEPLYYTPILPDTPLRHPISGRESDGQVLVATLKMGQAAGRATRRPQSGSNRPHLADNQAASPDAHGSKTATRVAKRFIAPEDGLTTSATPTTERRQHGGGSWSRTDVLLTAFAVAAPTRIELVLPT